MEEHILSVAAISALMMFRRT